jgi:hypothetical protein
MAPPDACFVGIVQSSCDLQVKPPAEASFSFILRTITITSMPLVRLLATGGGAEFPKQVELRQILIGVKKNYREGSRPAELAAVSPWETLAGNPTPPDVGSGPDFPKNRGKPELISHHASGRHLPPRPSRRSVDRTSSGRRSCPAA